MPRRTKIQPDEKVPVKFSPRERELVLDHTFAAPDLAEPLEAAPMVDGAYMVSHTLEKLEDLIGSIAAEANHTDDKKLERELDKLCDRLEKEMESYDDGQLQEAL